MKHTPGPWTLDLGNIGDYVKGHVSVDAPDHGGIAQVVWVMDDDASEGNTTSQCEANARLIAAAPDMLEALQNIENDDGHMPNSAWQMIKNAIAKATGGQA